MLPPACSRLSEPPSRPGSCTKATPHDRSLTNITPSHSDKCTQHPAVCSGPQESLGETSSAITIGGHQANLYHRNPPSSTGTTGSEYVLQIVVNGRCYSIFWLFIAVPDVPVRAL